MTRFGADGGLAPRRVGEPFASIAQCGDPHALAGSGIVCGFGAVNSVVAHQWNQTGAFPSGTSGMSTTPHFDRTRFYALGHGHTSGFVIEFDVDLLRRRL